ncbi:right-handed parallel beta-helix repeat-containing protein, partial [bacterium]|nr:right-handed parallel beta-helix repeat-containing protein [bacterium]
GIYINRADNVTIKNVEVYETYRQCLVINYGADNALIEDCDLHHGAKVYILWNQKISRQDPPTVTVKHSDRPVFRRTKIHDSYNEGINIDVGSKNAIVEYCKIYGQMSNLYLVNSTNNTVRYNLIYGTGNAATGIKSNNESQWNKPNLITNNKIYGNLVANCSKNFWIGGASNRKVSNVTAYNNIFIEATDAAVQLQPGTGSGHVFKNNIIWQTKNKIAYIPTNLMTCNYNLWSKEPDVDGQGANDPPYAAPLIAKTTGWNSLRGEDLDGSEFALQSNSPAIDAGASLAAEFNNIPECNKSIWPTQITLMRQDNQGSGWEIGADIYDANPNPTALDPPTGLTITSP